MANNESIKELRENRYRQYSRKLKTLQQDMKDATENSFNIIENNNHAFRSIKSPGSNKEFRMPHHVVSKHLEVIKNE